MTTITQIDTSTLSNQSLVTALLVHTFTNTTRARKVFVQVDLDQIAGNGNYVVYATIQRAGAGSAFRVVPITTAAVASGITSAAFQTAGFPLNSTDVLKVYVTGLAGDTTTPDIVTRVWEELPLAATTAGRTLDVSTGGESGIDWGNIGSPTATVGLTGTTVALDPATQTQINNIESAVSAGSGARTVTITVNDGTTTLQNARVRLTEGANSRTALTNASGVAVLNLDDATYTVAITKSGYAYSGTTMVVNSDETATYSMTATNVTSPTNPDLSAIEVLCLDDDFEAVAGVEVNFRMAAIASGDQNRAHPGAKKTVTSNSSGIARFEGPQGATIEWKRGTGQQWTAVVLDNDSVTNVTSTIGSP